MLPFISINEGHVYEGEIFLFSEYVTDNSIKLHVPGEQGTIKHTKPPKLYLQKQQL